MLDCISRCIWSITALQIADCVEVTGDDDGIKKTNLPDVAFIIALDLLVGPQNMWLRGNGPLRLIRWTNNGHQQMVLYFFISPALPPLAEEDNGRQ